MEANGSRIVGIRYPENTKPKWFGHVSRNSKHMLIDLEDGRTITDEPVSYTHLTLPTSDLV